MTAQTNTRTDNHSSAPKALTPEDRSALRAVTIFPVLIIAATAEICFCAHSRGRKDWQRVDL